MRSGNVAEKEQLPCRCSDVDTCQRDSRWIARENGGGQMSVIREESRWV